MSNVTTNETARDTLSALLDSEQPAELFGEKERLYHVIVQNMKTGRKVLMTASPVSHHTGCVILSKLGSHPCRLEMLEEVVA